MLTEGSLTRAATRLNTTQPSLSKALARLRTHFEDPLLVRDGQIMRPTPKGTGMLTPIRELLGAAKGIGNAANGRFDPASSSRKFRLIVSDVGMVLFLPASDRAPGCQRRKAEAGSHTAGFSQLRSQAGQWGSGPRARRLRQGASRPASAAALCGQLPQRGAPRPSEETASGTDRRISCRATHRRHGFGDRTHRAPDGAGSHRGHGRGGPRAAAPAELHCRSTGRG